MAWLGTWRKRIALTIDCTKIDATQTDFPCLIYLSAASGIGDVDASCVFDELGSDANRFKIAITSDDGTTQLYVEIEQWDDANEKAWLHVKMPSISSSVDTVLCLYYDSYQADNTTYVGDTNSSPAESVWESANLIVYHFDQDPEGTILDSTDNDNDGTPGGTMSSGDLIVGQVGQALDMDGDDDCIDLAGDIDISGACTIVVLGKITSYTNRPGIGGNDTTAVDGRVCLYDTQTVKFSTQTSEDNLIALTGYLPSGSYFLVIVTRDSSDNLKAYLNGVDITDGTPNFPGSILWHRIGDAPDDSGLKAWYGPLDEFRLLDVCKAAAWIKATSNSLFDTLITFEAEETTAVTVDVPIVTMYLSSQNPSSIYPIKIDVPLTTMSLWRPFSYILSVLSAILRTQTKYILTLTGWLDSVSDIEIPISSFSCRLSRVTQRNLISIPEWAQDTDYLAGQIVKPTYANGYQYKCIIPGRSASAGGGTSFPAWILYRAYGIGQRIIPTTSNGHWYQAQNRGWTGWPEPTWPTGSHESVVNGGITWREGGLTSLDSGEPAWPTNVAETVNDNTVLWENIGHCQAWQAETYYEAGEIIQPSAENYHQYLCTLTGTSGATEPSWPTSNHVGISDGDIIWIEFGTVPHSILTSITVEIPDATTWMAAINLRLNGALSLRREYQFAGGSQVESWYDADMQDIMTKFLPSFNSLSLTGTKTLPAEYLSGSRTISLVNPQSKSSESLGAWRFSRNAKTQYRCDVNTVLRPGDIASINGELIAVNDILIVVGSNISYMDIESV